MRGRSPGWICRFPGCCWGFFATDKCLSSEFLDRWLEEKPHVCYINPQSIKAVYVHRRETLGSPVSLGNLLKAIHPSSTTQFRNGIAHTSRLQALQSAPPAGGWRFQAESGDGAFPFSWAKEQVCAKTIGGHLGADMARYIFILDGILCIHRLNLYPAFSWGFYIPAQGDLQ